MSKNVLALDQGTTSSRAVVFNRMGESVAVAQQEFPQILPAPGHVEHDPEAIWQSQLTVAKQAISNASLSADQIAAIGITNQRETTVVWDRTTGEPVANAIVWQSRVTAPFCDQLRAEGYEETIRKKTGLKLDAYFSATKIVHLLDQHDSTRERADRGELLFGTIDSFLIWRFTGGRVHATDYSNASRTLLFNIETLDWDDELLKIFNIPRAMLPQVLPSSYRYGETEPALLGARVPITGDAGDQHAATFGQACFQPGNAKNTYGTGCFLLMNTGNEIVRSQNQLITTIGWGYDNTVTYCLEGSVFIAGAVVQWLRDGLGVIEKSSDVEALAATVPDSDGVYFVPAFVGLGAPYWDPYARGAVFGITRGTTAGHLARAALESMAFQTRDLIEAMQKDAGIEVKELKVDGGAATNDLLMQFQCDLLDATIRRPVISETTALGAAYLAGLQVGVWSGMDDVTGNWMLDREFRPELERSIADRRYEKWQRAVQRSLAWESA